MFDGAANISITPGNDLCKRQSECVVSHLTWLPFKQVIKTAHIRFRYRKQTTLLFAADSVTLARVTEYTATPAQHPGERSAQAQSPLQFTAFP